MRFKVNWPVLDLGAGRIISKEIAVLQIFFRSDWPLNKAAAAVRANVLQNIIGALRAKRAFVAANPRCQRRGRQAFVAVLASGSDFQHGVLS